MLKIIIIITPILIIATLPQCKGFRSDNPSLMDLNKSMIFFNYTTNEICLLDIDTGVVGKKYKLAFNVHKYNFNKWYYSNGDAYIYLLERRRDSGTKIYKIGIDTFELSEIYRTKKYFHNFCINNNYLYLMSYVEPSNQNPNKEQNYILEHNLLSGSEKIIDFNKSLPKDERICSPDFFVHENRIIMTGWVKEHALKKLYQYDIKSKKINVIDEKAGYFSIFDDIILYTKNNVDVVFVNDFVTTIRWKGASLAIYDIKNNTSKVLPYKVNTAYLDFLTINKSVMIYTNEHKTIQTLINRFWLFPIKRRYKDYYIAEINGNDQRLFFSSADTIKILGVIDNK